MIWLDHQIHCHTSTLGGNKANGDEHVIRDILSNLEFNIENNSSICLFVCVCSCLNSGWASCNRVTERFKSITSFSIWCTRGVVLPCYDTFLLFLLLPCSLLLCFFFFLPRYPSSPPSFFFFSHLISYSSSLSPSPFHQLLFYFLCCGVDDCQSQKIGHTSLDLMWSGHLKNAGSQCLDYPRPWTQIWNLTSGDDNSLLSWLQIAWWFA